MIDESSDVLSHGEELLSEALACLLESSDEENAFLYGESDEVSSSRYYMYEEDSSLGMVAENDVPYGYEDDEEKESHNDKQFEE